MLFRALVIFQPFLFIWIYEDDKFNFLNEGYGETASLSFQLFMIASFLCLVAVVLLEISIGYYTAYLLSIYIFMVLAMNYGLIGFFETKKTIALSFLLVYVNSLYWESFLHVWAINEHGLNMNQAFQILSHFENKMGKGDLRP